MFFRNEIKDFIKNTLILTLFFTLVLHLSWGYIAPMLGVSTNASSNDARFTQSNVTYLGNIATAMSLNIGQKLKQTTNTPIDLSNDVISIAEVLSNPTDGQKRLIGGNMVAISTYANLLKTDVVKMLDGATDRASALDEYISLLKDYGNKTNERLALLSEQIADLNAILTKSASDTTTAKADMQTSYDGLDYSNVDAAISAYTEAKQADIRARVYLVYLQNFQSFYNILQTKNKKILDTLTINHEALVKRSIVVIPDSGTDILNSLNLIQTQSQYNASKVLQ